KVLEAMGYRFDGVTWHGPSDAPSWPEADRLHALLMDRAERVGRLYRELTRRGRAESHCRRFGGLRGAAVAGGEDCGRLGMDDARRGKARRTKRSGARHLAGCVSRLSSQRQKGKLDHPTHVAAVKAVLE